MKYKVLKELGIILFISIILNFTYLNKIIQIYFTSLKPWIYIFITLLVIYYFIKTIIDITNLYFLIVTYFVFMIIMLYFRKVNYQNIQTEFYLFEWMKLIFTNKTIFINIVGNILIFIPFGFILKCIFNNYLCVFILSLIIIVLIEIIQYKILVGVFDIVDIVLNYIGTVIGILGERVIHDQRTKRRKGRNS